MPGSNRSCEKTAYIFLIGLRNVVLGPSGWEPLISVAKRRVPILISAAGVTELSKIASMLMGREGRVVEAGVGVKVGAAVGTMGVEVALAAGGIAGGIVGELGIGVERISATTGVARGVVVRSPGVGAGD